MSLTNFPNGVSSFGIPMIGSLPMVLGASGMGEIWFVDATNGSDGNTGLSAEKAFATLAVAYAAASSGDTITLSTNATHELAAGIAWSKSRINLVGLDMPGRVLQQGAKVQLVTAATTAYVIRNTGTRNSFINVKFIQSSTEATALHVWEEGGEGTLFQNCSFVIDVDDNLSDTSATEFVMGGDSCTFRECEFGLDTLVSTATTRSIMTIDTVTGGPDDCKSSRFIDCTWIGASTDADLQAITVSAVGDLLFTTHLIRPSFIASINSTLSTIACTKAISTPDGTANGTILISYPMVHGFTDLGVNGTNNDGLYVYSHAVSGATLTSVAPTT